MMVCPGRIDKRPLHHGISANRNRNYYDLNTTNNAGLKLPEISCSLAIVRVIE